MIQVSWLSMYRMLEEQHRTQLQSQYTEHQRIISDMQRQLEGELLHQQQSMRQKLDTHREVSDEVFSQNGCWGGGGGGTHHEVSDEVFSQNGCWEGGGGGTHHEVSDEVFSQNGCWGGEGEGTHQKVTDEVFSQNGCWGGGGRAPTRR